MFQKVVLITGASKGIGQEIAKTLAKNNYKVIANYNKSEESAKKLYEELKSENIDIDIFQADVSNRKNVKDLVNFTLEKYKKIDVLINNAGISENKLFTDVTDEDWNKLINTNLYSAFCATQEVLPNMIHNKSRLHNKYFFNMGNCWSIL